MGGCRARLEKAASPEGGNDSNWKCGADEMLLHEASRPKTSSNSKTSLVAKAAPIDIEAAVSFRVSGFDGVQVELFLSHNLASRLE